MMLLINFLGLKDWRFIKKTLQYRLQKYDTKKFKKGSLRMVLKKLLNNGAKKAP